MYRARLFDLRYVAQRLQEWYLCFLRLLMLCDTSVFYVDDVITKFCYGKTN